MFWRKKEKVSWPLVIFGIIAFFIIVSIAVLLLMLVSKPRSRSSYYPIAEGFDNLIKNKINNSVVIVEKYNMEMNDLVLFVKSASDMDDVFTRVEDTFLATRVPAEKRDLHLQSLLKVVSLKNSIEDVDDIKGELVKILEKLLD